MALLPAQTYRTMDVIPPLARSNAFGCLNYITNAPEPACRLWWKVLEAACRRTGAPGVAGKSFNGAATSEGKITSLENTAISRTG